MPLDTLQWFDKAILQGILQAGLIEVSNLAAPIDHRLYMLASNLQIQFKMSLPSQHDWVCVHDEGLTFGYLSL
jgi:hypothetical protein